MEEVLKIFRKESQCPTSLKISVEHCANPYFLEFTEKRCFDECAKRKAVLEMGVIQPEL